METVGPYYAWLAGIPLGLLGFVCLPFMTKIKHTIASEVNDSPPDLDPDPELEADEVVPRATIAGQLKESVNRLVRYLKHMLSNLFHNRPLLIGLFAMFVVKVARPLKDIITQFITAKFAWPISQVCDLLRFHHSCFYLTILTTSYQC